MNYDKLSRSLRYYYEKGIMQKVKARSVFFFSSLSSCVLNEANIVTLIFKYNHEPSSDLNHW